MYVYQRARMKAAYRNQRYSTNRLVFIHQRIPVAMTTEEQDLSASAVPALKVDHVTRLDKNGNIAKIENAPGLITVGEDKKNDKRQGSARSRNSSGEFSNYGFTFVCKKNFVVL